MTQTFTGKQMGLAVACALALGSVSGVASAQIDPSTTGYVTDQRGVVVKSDYGLCWRTGYWTPALAITECDPDLMPKIMAAAPPAQPATQPPVTAPKPVSLQPAAAKVTLDADALFDFDKAVLRPGGKLSLDEFLEKMKAIDPEVIIAVGHADRFGSEGYNQNLSERRAAAVKSYLLGKGIDTNRVHTEGKGELQPTTKAGECVGAKSAKVIACLQPDRRVSIEVVGTRTTK